MARMYEYTKSDGHRILLNLDQVLSFEEDPQGCGVLVVFSNNRVVLMRETFDDICASMVSLLLRES